MPTQEPVTDLDEADADGGGTWVGRIFRLVLVIVILGAGAWISIGWLGSRPSAQRRRPTRDARLVEVAEVVRGSEQVNVTAMGTVQPAREVKVAARVGGQVVEVSAEFVRGGYFRAGERILQLDRADYRLAIEERKSGLARAECDLEIELGRQDIARHEYKLLGEEIGADDEGLLLREPHLVMTEAAVAAAKAALEKARLDLDRTEVAAPFNAVVRSTAVELGSQVSAGAVLGTLVGSEKYWVEVAVPVDQLRWIKIPGFNSQFGSAARISYESAWGAGAYRTGTVEKLVSELEPEGRMARLLVGVDDPLQLEIAWAERLPLILNSYVKVELEGVEIPDVAKVPRSALRQGDRVWVMDDEGKLEIRRVETVWSDQSVVYVGGGLSAGDLLVTGDLGAPVEGMALRTDRGEPGPPGVALEGDGAPEEKEGDEDV